MLKTIKSSGLDKVNKQNAITSLRYREGASHWNSASTRTWSLGAARLSIIMVIPYTCCISSIAIPDVLLQRTKMVREPSARFH